MFLRIARDIAKPQSFAILDLLKRSTGLPVKEMANTLKMSYMGIKQHCLELEKKGLVDTWRRPGGMGRPEKLYRLTPKAAAFYPEAGNELTLEILQSIQEVYGPSAPDKLLFNHFGRKTESYRKQVKGNTITGRAESFARIRNQEGYCTEVEFDPMGGFRIVEFHDPMKAIAAAFPSIRQMETRMVQQILQAEVLRTEERAGGLAKVAWVVPAVGHGHAMAS